MAVQFDKIHYTTRKIDGYNMSFNFIVSEREAGKSTYIWIKKAYEKFKKFGYTTLVIRRNVVDITDVYINDISNILNKFTDDNIILNYNKSSLKDGIVNVKIGDTLFMRVIGLSMKISNAKSLMLPSLRTIIFDEFICNQRFGEKYLKDEATKFAEIFNTFQRECPPNTLKCYFMGNPYSLYNPYFIFFQIPTSELRRGNIYSNGLNAVVECYELTKELKQFILERNPLYKFDNSYTRYAFDGVAVNDINIALRDELPQHYQLKFLFKVGEKYLSIWENQNWFIEDMRFYCQPITRDKISKRRDVFCFDIADLVDRTILLSREEREKFSKLRSSIRHRTIEFKDIECYYLIEEIYNNL